MPKIQGRLDTALIGRYPHFVVDNGAIYKASLWMSSGDQPVNLIFYCGNNRGEVDRTTLRGWLIIN